MKKKKYVKPLVTVIGMEAEPVLASFSSYNTTGKPADAGVDIVDDGTMPGNDGTDLEDKYGNKYGQNSYSVWD